MLKEIIETLKLPLELVLLAVLLCFMPIPQSWQVAIPGTCTILYWATAYAWAQIFEGNKFWFCVWFVVCLIPYVRLAAFALLTVYVICSVVRDEMKPSTPLAK